jgi:membrane protease YdiL (CAAX protease family)
MENVPTGPVMEAPPAEAPVRRVSYWHTAALVVVLLALSLGNASASRRAHLAHAHVRLYIVTIVYEWLLAGYVWWGLRRGGITLRELIGGRWNSIADCFLDFLIACGTWFCALMLLAVAAVAMGMHHASNLSEAQKQLGYLAPQSMLEIGLWIGLSASAGICEEILFRGYLQMQFTRLLRNRWSALIVASILFGLSHGYEGAQRMVLIALLGAVLGVLSLARKSLRPAMMAHTLQDTISGLLLRTIR